MAAAVDLQTRQEIIDLLTRYTIALDTPDLELLRTVYTDTTTDVHGFGSGKGVDWFIEFVRGGIERAKATQHFLGQSLIEIDGDTASGRTYVTAYHVGRDEFEDQLYVASGWYVDVFTRTEDGWRIADRQVVVAWSEGDSRIVTG